MYKIIGLTGYALAGKDSVADILVKHFGYHKLAFAAPLKAGALAINPYVEVELHGGMKAFSRLDAVVFTLGWDEAKKNPDVRRLLQRLGTEFGRNLVSETLWIDLHRKSVEALGPDAKVTVPDMRFFPNEYNYVHDQGGLTIRITNPNLKDNGVGLKHPSEALIDSIPADIYLSNDGTLEDLEQKVLALPIWT